MPQPTTDEFIINTTWPYAGSGLADVATLTNGNIVVTWAAYDYDYVSVFGRIYQPDGTPIGDDDLIIHGSNISEVELLALDNGGFAVVTSEDSLFDDDQSILFTYTFDAAGNALSDQQVEPGGWPLTFGAEIVSRSDGGYSILYTDERYTIGEGDGGFGFNNFIRHFTAEGEPIGGNKYLNRSFPGDQSFPEAARLTNGNNVALWTDKASDGKIVTKGAILDADGGFVGDEFTLLEDVAVADVGALTNGKFVVLWVDEAPRTGPDQTTYLYGQVFGEDGRAESTKFLINTTSAESLGDPNVAALQGGGFVVVWNQWSQEPDDRSKAFGQAFSEYGVHVDGNFLIDQTPPSAPKGGNFSVEVTGTHDGGFFVSYESTTIDERGSAIVGRVYSGLTAEEASRGGPTLPTEGADLIVGRARDEQLWGLGGDDTIFGAGGRDLIWGGSGADRILGGIGNDAVRGGFDNDTIYGQGGDDRLFGEAGHDLIAGGGGKDEIFGGIGDDRLSGDDGDDRLFGEAGNDTLAGGVGNDTLTGGQDADHLTGGYGADLFVFNSAFETRVWGRDTITDFQQSQNDRIALRAMDADTTLRGDQAFDFIGRAKFSGDAGELRFEHRDGNTLISGDVNGDGKADFAIQLIGRIALDLDDFIL
ncbi:hypothetical protein JJJ17_07795 [Paracoccus caeni]|uniref:Peptidase M10 serralysin C-terminal domain-containing protein n=1 Tax=Paracoccus caeni TaxID=657651 RepID=A0A934VZZ8_9RHOB|nr:hypothetical protein [Paracoccus caeni]MBK4215823.1 hypothetical protein [Paracoccus caeni]